jgi:transcription termination/antitermination protein NusG
MSYPTDETREPITNPDRTANSMDTPVPAAGPIGAPAGIEVEEQTPEGGRPDTPPSSRASGLRAEDEETPDVEDGGGDAPEPPAALDQEDDDPPPQLVWYVLKVQSSREDTIRDALERRVKIQGLQPYFGRIVVPTEKITEIRNNKKRVVERKTYPGYIMVEMELNEKTWFVVRETPGVGDFVGAHGTPTKMTEAEVNQMLGQETAKTEEAPRVRIDVERGDRVKIKDGPFENFEGTVEEVIEQRGLVKVMLIIFNRPTPVDLEYWQVERI